MVPGFQLSAISPLITSRYFTRIFEVTVSFTMKWGNTRCLTCWCPCKTRKQPVSWRNVTRNVIFLEEFHFPVLASILIIWDTVGRISPDIKSLTLLYHHDHLRVTVTHIGSPVHSGNGQVEEISPFGGLYCADQGAGWPNSSFLASYFGVLLILPLALDTLQNTLKMSHFKRVKVTAATY